MISNKLFKIICVTLLAAFFAACGGGSSGPVESFVYQDVYGQACQGVTSPTPGCTFIKYIGGYYNGMVLRARAGDDPSGKIVYHSCGTLGLGTCSTYHFPYTVHFDSSGNGSVYDLNGSLLYTKHVSQFPGFISGSTIGVGTDGSYWVDIRSKSYWMGSTGVLYDSDRNSNNYSGAINSKDAHDTTSDTNFSALATEAQKGMIKQATDRLVKKYNLPQQTATAIATSLHSWAVRAETQGYSTPEDLTHAFTATFGVQSSEVLNAMAQLREGKTQEVIRLTNRSATHLGLQPHEAKKILNLFIENAAAEFGYNIENLKW